VVTITFEAGVMAKQNVWLVDFKQMSELPGEYLKKFEGGTPPGIGNLGNLAHLRPEMLS